MAKELPYFQFEPAEYLTKDISFCSLSAQGLFTNVCSYYWQRQCNLTKTQFLRRLNHPKELQELIDEGVIDFENDTIKIKFLDLQYEKATIKSNTNSLNGSKGGRPKKIKAIKSENKANGLIPLSESKGIREEKRKEEEKKEDKIILNESSIYPIQNLFDYYLIKEDVILAMVKNKENKFKSKEHLITRLKEYQSVLIESGKTTESWLEYAKYFRNWNKYAKKNVKPNLRPSGKLIDL